MGAVDSSLIERAKPHFLDAITTFGKPGDDLYRLAQIIVQEAKMAGFSKRGRRSMLEHLFAFVEDMLSKRIDPFEYGKSVQEPLTLFSSGRLGGIFDVDALLPEPSQNELILASATDDEARDRALIEQLIAATHLYESSDAVKDLMNFIIRLRAFAPFNAMLLHIQKPGLTHAATASDWHRRFGRVPKVGVRPLIVLRAMGPVDFVFDVLDTEGRDIPESAFSFPTLGGLDKARFAMIVGRIANDGIDIVEMDAGDAKAGWIKLASRSTNPTGKHRYQLAYNRNHPAVTQLVTVAHELAHLFLGHLGDDVGRRVRDRRDRTVEQREAEAEMAAYLVAKRNGLSPRSESYLSSYKGALAEIDLYGVMRAANSIENAMGIQAHHLKKKA